MKSLFRIALGTALVTVLIFNTPVAHAITAAKSATSSSTKATASTTPATKTNSTSKEAVSSTSAVKVKASEAKTTTTKKTTTSIMTDSIKAKDFTGTLDLKKDRTVQSDESDIFSGAKSDVALGDIICDTDDEFYKKDSRCEGIEGSWIEGSMTGDGVQFFHCCQDSYRDGSFIMYQSDYYGMEELIEDTLTSLEEYLEECSIEDCKSYSNNEAKTHLNWEVRDTGQSCGSIASYTNQSGEAYDNAQQAYNEGPSLSYCCQKSGCMMQQNDDGEDSCDCSSEDRSEDETKKKIDDVTECVTNQSENPTRGTVQYSYQNCLAQYDTLQNSVYDECRNRCRD